MNILCQGIFKKGISILETVSLILIYRNRFLGKLRYWVGYIMESIWVTEIDVGNILMGSHGYTHVGMGHYVFLENNK